MPRLAIHGGPPACPQGSIPSWPVFDHTEEDALLRTLRSRRWWRIPGSEVDAFERAFARFHEVEHALAVTNGTQALEIVLASLGIGHGDEVIVPAFSFAATITAVSYAGALPVTIDVDLDTYCMTPERFERAITPRTRAVIPVHLAGQSCDLDAILAIARRHDIRVISDAAHAHGARYAGRALATLGHAAIYSFQSGKLMTAGEGGALLTNDGDLAATIWLKHSCGRPRQDKRYEHVTLGTNARMSEFQGAVLSAQLARLPEQLAERERGAARLDDLLRKLPGIFLQARPSWVDRHSHYMYMVRIDPRRCGVTRDALVDALVAEGVPAFRSYMALCDLPLYRQAALWGGEPPPSLRPDRVREALSRWPADNARQLGADSLWLHHPVLLGGESVQRAVADAFAKVLSESPREEQPAARSTSSAA